jgi:fibronectin-binding autotransporter adhesin
LIHSENPAAGPALPTRTKIMPRRSTYLPLKRLAWLAVAISFFAGSWAGAQTDYFWQAPAGGDGFWDNVSPSWSLAAAGPSTLAWPNTGAEVANFGNATGTVTIATGGLGINAFGVKFTTTGYTITGDPLTLMGTGGVIDTTTVGATINSIISGSVGLTKNGTGTLTLGGANNYTGGTTVNAGVIVLTNPGALGDTAIGTTVMSGAAVQVGGGVTNIAQPITLFGTGVANGGALRNTAGNDTWTGAITLGAGGARINSDAGTLTISTGGLSAGSSGNSLTVGGAGNVNFNSSIASLGTGALNKDGAGTLTLANLSTTGWTGPVNITGGLVSIPNLGSFGTVGTVTLDGGALRETNPGNAGSFVSATRPIFIGPNGGTVDYTPTGQAVVDLSFVTIYAPTTATFGGTGVLTKTGPSEFRFQGNATATATYSKLVVNQGLFRLGNSGANAETGFGAVPAAFTSDAITLNGGEIGTSFNITLNSNRGITLGPNGGTINTSAATMTIPGAITGSGALKQSTGTLTLQGAASDYTGSTTIGSVTTTTPSGTMSVAALANGGSPSAIGASSNTVGNLVLNGGSLTYTGPAVSTDRLFSITSLGGTLTASGTGPITFTNTGANLSTDKAVTNFTVNSGSTFAVLATGGNPADLTGIMVGMSVTGAGIPAGTTVAGVAATLTEFTLSAAATGTTANTPVTFTSLNRTLTLTGTNTGPNTIAGILGNSPTTTLALTKAAASTWVLTGANTYTGPTAVNAGTLQIGSTPGGPGSLAAGSTVTVNSGGQLAGYGTINGPATVANGATVSPGSAAPGTLTFGNTLTLPGTYAWKLGTAGASDPTFSGLSTPPGAQTNHDALAATSPIDLTSSTLTLNSLGTTGFNNALPYSWRIATGSGVTSFPTIGTISGADFSNLNGGTFSVANTGTALLLNFTPTPVPEPAFVLLACLGATGLAAIRRRRTA